MAKGKVIKSTGSNYLVRNDEGEIIDCKIKGRFRTKGIRTTNPISVGDNVEYKMEDANDMGVIHHIEERKNYIIRKSTNLSKESHIIAANVDQALLFVCVNYPETSTVFIDRFIASAEAYSIDVKIIVNKKDMYNEAELEEAEYLVALYESIGYESYLISAHNEDDLKLISNLIKDKTNVLAGHSGVGKSTIINSIEPNLQLKTSEISQVHQSGKHTTTFAEMHTLSSGGYIIDTPGIRGFGLIDIDREELHHFFRDIFEYSSSCQFNNCIHLNEPKCAVKQAVEDGEIAGSRYYSYLSILEQDNERYR